MQIVSRVYSPARIYLYFMVKRVFYTVFRPSIYFDISFVR